MSNTTVTNKSIDLVFPLSRDNLAVALRILTETETNIASISISESQLPESELSEYINSNNNSVLENQ